MNSTQQQFHIVLAGKINDPYFHKCMACTRYLEQTYPKQVTVTVLQYFETQWEEYIKKIQNEKKGPFYHHKATTLVYFNDINYIGDHEAFLEWVLGEFRYIDNSNLIIYKKKATDAVKQLIENTPGREYVYLDVTINGQVQKVVLELFSEFAPKTCENFRKICNGAFTNKNGQKLSYVGTEFFRVVKGMYIQAGDLSKNGIKEHSSVFEGEFPDESFHLKHTEIGLLGMCKKKGYKHTNESQFYITTSAPLSFMDNKYVVFGRVISGMRALKLIEKSDQVNERPVQAALITAAGDYTVSKKLDIKAR